VSRDGEMLGGEADRLAASLRDVPVPVPPALGDALEAELAAMKPVAPRRPARSLAIALAASLVYAGAFLAVLRIRRDLDGLPVGWLVAYAGAWFVGFASLLYLAVMPRRGSMLPRWRAAGTGAAVAAIGFVAAGLLLHRGTPDSTYYGLAHIYRGHACLEIGLAVALVPATIGAIALRGVLPVGSRWAAAGLGAAGGSLGGLVLHLHCPIADGWHLGLVHGGVVVVSAILAAVIAPRARLAP